MDVYIKKNDLVRGKAYFVDARNFSVAIWTGESFAGLRSLYPEGFMIDYEHHYDDGAPHGTVKPLKLLT